MPFSFRGRCAVPLPRDLGEGWGEEEAERRGFTSAVETFSTFPVFAVFTAFAAFAAFTVFSVCAGVCPAAGEAVLRVDAGVMRRSGVVGMFCSLQPVRDGGGHAPPRTGHGTATGPVFRALSLTGKIRPGKIRPAKD